MKKINTVMFLITLFATSLLSILNLFDPNKAEISEIENRALKTKPVLSADALASGRYFRELEDYFADHFVFRDQLVKASGTLLSLQSLANSDEVSIVINRGDNTGDAHAGADGEPPDSEPADKEPEQPGDTDSENLLPGQEVPGPAPAAPDDSHSPNQGQGDSAPSETSLPGEEPVPPPAPANNPANNEETRIGKVLIIGDKAMNIYDFNQSAAQHYAEALNLFRQKLDESVQIYSLLAPTQIEFIQSQKYRDLSAPQAEIINYINGKYSGNITTVNALERLKEHQDEYLFFRSDHHWTALGAYYAYTAFMDSIRETPVPLTQYETDKVEGFLGSTYSSTLNKKIENNPDTVFIYKPAVAHTYKVFYEGAVKMNVIDMSHADKKNKYRIFLSGDRPQGLIETEADTDKKIVVIKDSFGNAFVPFLIPHYKEIHIVDPRQFKGNIVKLIQDNGIQDVLFVANVGATTHTGFSGLIKEMLEKAGE